MKTMSRFLAMSVLFSSWPAFAGIVDSPLPELLAGKTTYHLYSVLGITNPGGTAVMFSCTSTDTAPMQVGVELFGQFGGAPSNDAAASSVSAVSGQTVIFGTSITPYINPNVVVSFPESRGSARILATSKKVACDAFMLDATDVIPNSMRSLTIIAKTKQKACN